MSKINVLIVDDSAFMRKVISSMISSDDQIEVIATAKNGMEAVEKVKQLKPDVVTLDIEMPKLNGLEALKIIMKESPVPVVMLSSLTKEGASSTILAMENGAVDFVQKPSGSISLDIDLVQDELIKKVKMAVNVNVKNLVNHQPIKQFSSFENNRKENLHERASQIVCLGTSTGGPKALQEVLSKLPERFKKPIFIVQHMPSGFTNSLANRLDKLSNIHVKEAEHGEKVEQSTAYIAPGGYHMVVNQRNNELFIELNKEPQISGHRPSVDVLFESVSNLTGYHVISVILTGMGSDGSKGLIKIKEKLSSIAIAESEETSVVFGMPKAAIATKLVDEIVTIQNIADTIIKHSN
ncbi:chemotaxis response regulator protein-glutamate methylesterase [Bacillus sp. RG28]|uniref:Protein-glutamate methylesterase/protein-glutamine glutaminase n=1 Tax=Gottfriedia endophytica TaxID=2820819 RepID=A0A940NKN4_9BACI|nr:chemotaxis response regulator protein-glutamate methylesterase [Gottfriedia endophytica]MBP0726220.1 chemotaxis response regulator protein-glutamate methylesterase [Gottfriedia endophytica]